MGGIKKEIPQVIKENKAKFAQNSALKALDFL